MKQIINRSNSLINNEMNLFLSHLTEEELGIYCKHRVELKFKKGQDICKQGSFANHVFYLKEGLVKLYTEGDKKNIILSVYKPPVYVGLLSLFGENFYQFSLSALEDSKVCLIELDWFKKLITLNGNFGLEVITYLSQSANYILHNKIKMGQKQMRGKVASVVLFFYRNIFEKLDFTLPITRKEMAEFAGLSTENLITALSEFRKDKLIEVDGKKINILNAAGLEEISNHY
ncbi:MAG TPA: hypothetical protein DEH02_14570 [Bacteroidales bacterium]|nr:MAG: hypothetical protein A2491_12620 [Bacteroidetes bacterium RIFOXYC12_FULL_35_7]HBX52285.1 hypothetical protein [Bacteroidales bacterium]